MGSIGSERKDKSASEISLKLRDSFYITTTEAFRFWKKYHLLKEKEPDFTIKTVMDYLYNNSNDRIIKYFAALAMEIISKEIIEGINEK